MKENYQFIFYSNDSNDRVQEGRCRYYHAFYFGSNDLIIYHLDFDWWEIERDLPSLPRCPSDYFPDLPFIYGKEAWDIFYTNATIGEVIAPMGILPPTEITQAEIKKAVGSGFSKSVSKWGFTPPDYKTVLTLIREKPEALHHEIVRNRFIEILTEAKDFVNKEEAERAKYLIEDCLIQKNPGGKKIVPSDRCRLAISLAKQLAKHLSGKCKSYLDGDISLLDDKEARKDIYTLDFRISILHIDSLKNLILKPSEFVEKLVSKEFNISIKTLTDKRSRNGQLKF